MMAEMWKDVLEGDGLPTKILPVGDIMEWGERVSFKIYVPKGREHEADEIVGRAQELRIPSGRLNDCAQLRSDPQLAARDFWVEVEHPYAGRQTYPGAPFKMSETPFQLTRAPLLGEHNEDILVNELGLSPEEIRT